MAAPLRLGIPTPLLDTQEDEDQNNSLLDVKPLTPDQPQDEGVKVAALGGSMFSYLRPAEAPTPAKQRTEPQSAEPVSVPSMFSYLSQSAEAPKPVKEPGLELGKSVAKGIKGLGLTWDYIKSRVDRQIEKVAFGDTKVTDALLAKSAEEYAAMESDPRIAEMVKLGDDESKSTSTAAADMLGFALRNPTMVANFIAEQVPGMVVGGGVGGVLTAPLRAGAVNLATKAGVTSAKGLALASAAPLGAGINTGAVVFQSLGTNYAEGLNKFDGDDAQASEYAIKKTAGEVPANAVAGAFLGLKPFAAAGMAGKVGNVATQGVIQGAGGAAGAASGSLAVGEEISRGELLLEFLAEFASAPGDILMSRIGKEKDTQDNANVLKKYLDQVESDPTTDSGRQQLFEVMMQDPQMSAALQNRGIESADNPNFDSVAIAAQRVNSLLADIEIPTAEQRTETTKQRGADVAAAFGDTASTGVGVGTGTGDPVIQRDSVVANPETRTLDPVDGQAPVPVTLPDGAGTRAGTPAMSGEDLAAAQQGFEVESAFNVGTGQIANRFRSQAQAETFLFGPVGQDGKRTGGYASSVPDLDFQVRRGQTSKDAGGNAFFFVESRPQVAGPAPAAAPAPAAPAPVPAAGAPAPAAPAPAAPAPTAAAPAAPAQAPAAAPGAAPATKRKNIFSLERRAEVAWDLFGGAKFEALAPEVQQEWTEAVGEGYKPDVLANLYRNLSAPAATGATPATTGATPATTEAAPAVTPQAPAVTPGATAPAPAAPATPALPTELAGAKPRYGAGKNQFDLTFESDVDKALFIVAQPTKSKRDADYRAWLGTQGLLAADVEARAAQVRTAVKALVAGKPGGTITVPVVPQLAPTATPAAQATPATAPATPAVAAPAVPPAVPPSATAAPAAPAAPAVAAPAPAPAEAAPAPTPAAPIPKPAAAAPAPKPPAPAPKPAAEAPAPTPAAQKAIDAGRMVQARNQWGQYAPEGVKFESLSDENKARWRDAVEANTPNMELANELAGKKPEAATAPAPAQPKQTVEQKLKAKQKEKKAAPPAEPEARKVDDQEVIERWEDNDDGKAPHIAWADLPSGSKSAWRTAVEDNFSTIEEHDRIVKTVRANQRADNANAKAAENRKKDGDIVLRRAEGDSKGMSVTAVRKIVDGLRGVWTNMPPVIVVQNELALPESLGEMIDSGKVTNAKGVLDAKTGKVYILANNASGVADVVLTVAHEVTGHYGMRQILGGSYTKVMNDIYNGNKSVRELADNMMAAESYLTREQAVEEVLADMAEARAKLLSEGKPLPGQSRSALQQIFAAIRRWLRSVGVSYVSDSDINDLVSNARRYVVKGDVQAGSGEAALGSVLRTDKPTFYSALARGITGAKLGNVPASQWKSWLAGNAGKMGIKQEELGWVGVMDWLDLKGSEKVSKEQVADFVVTNQVRLNEVKLDDGMSDSELGEMVRDIGEDPDGMNRDDMLDVVSAHYGWKRKRLGEAKHKQYTLPGGENYTELILVDPKASPYKISDRIHFGDVTNGQAIGWLRMNERTDANGDTVLFLEELQSQRGQDGRETGFAKLDITRGEQGEWVLKAGSLTETYPASRFASMSEAKAWATENEILQPGVPDAPFVKDTKAWTALLLKRAIAYAQGRGISKIAWTTGDQQVERYKLSKQIDQVVYVKDKKTGNVTVSALKGGRTLVDKQVPQDKVASVVGKDLAQQIEENKGLELDNDNETSGIISGLDLDIGGDGLRSYYNSIVPSVAGKIIGQYQGKGETFDIDGTQHQGFTVPEALGRVVESDGLPLFRRKDYDAQFDDVPEETREMARRKGVPTPPTIRERLEALKPNLGKRLVQGTFDKARAIKDISEKAYMQVRLAASVDGAVEALLHFGQVFNDDGALNLKKNTKGLVEVMEPLAGETDRFLMWVASNRAGELKKQDRELFFTDDEITKLKKLNIGKMKDGRQRVAVYAETLRGMNELNRSVLDVARQSGLIDEAAYKKFASDIWYVPFYRYMEDDGTLSAAATSSGSVNQHFSKLLKGSERQLNDLMQNTLMNWSHILSASMKNAGSVETLKAANDLGGMVTRLEPINGTMGKDKAGNVRPLKDTVKVMEGGKTVHYDIDDPLLLQSLSAITGMDKNGFLLNIGRAFKTTLTRFVALNPTFKTNNLIRDSVQTPGLTDLGYNPLANVVQGIKEYQNNRGEALAGGGIFTMGNAFDGDRSAAVKRLIAKGVSTDDIIDTPEKAKRLARELWDKYDYVSDAMENANRLALYRQMRDKGASHLESAFAARDIQDFSSGGAWAAIRYANQVLPYFNARLQGLYKIGRDGISPLIKAVSGTANESERKKAAKFATMTGAVTAAGLMLYLGQKDDEEWKKREDWDRDMFFWFRIPGTERAIRIPKPFEMGAIATVAERALEQIVDKDVEGKVFGQRMMALLHDTFAMNPIPQAIRPLQEIAANKNGLTDAPIETLAQKRLSADERINPRTSGAGIVLNRLNSMVADGIGAVTGLDGESLKLSPIQYDYMLKAYLGWMGTVIQTASYHAAQGLKEGETPDLRVDDMLFIGNYVRSLPAQQSRYVTDFYKTAQKAAMAGADYRNAIAKGDEAKAEGIGNSKAELLELEPAYESTKKQLTDINNQIKAIEKDEELSGAEKRKQIDELYQERSDAAKEVELQRIRMKREQ